MNCNSELRIDPILIFTACLFLLVTIVLTTFFIPNKLDTFFSSKLVYRWEEKLETTHLPEMMFGDSSLVLKHMKSGTKIHFNAYDALLGWKKDALPPVEVPAAAQWKFRSKPFEQVILDYDYTFTTPYSGSETVETGSEENKGCLKWEDCDEQINVAKLASKEPILFYDEVVLYEDELADSGVSFLTVKVRVMPSCWFLLLRFWLRVDGALMRLRDTRVFCTFNENTVRCSPPRNPSRSLLLVNAGKRSPPVFLGAEKEEKKPELLPH
ncbi:hypothetical protein LXL04_019939 [Taraxacum kok-saghyz]